MYSVGHGPPTNPAEAKEWWRKEATRTDNCTSPSDSEVRLALMHFNGPWVKQDYAATQNAASVRDGNGRGLPKGAAESAKWWRIAAVQGHAKAQYCLGWMCDLGTGLSRNHAEAVKWFSKAAEQGYAEAQYQLGFMYYRGRGVPQS